MAHSGTCLIEGNILSYAVTAFSALAWAYVFAPRTFAVLPSHPPAANLAGLDAEEPCEVPTLANFTFYQGQDVAAEQMESLPGASAQEAGDACMAKMGCTGFSLVGGTATLKSGRGERYPLEEATPCDGYWLLTAAPDTAEGGVLPGRLHKSSGQENGLVEATSCVLVLPLRCAAMP